MPVNCDRIRDQLTSKLDGDANIHLWVGAWRRGVSWNHAKIIVSSRESDPALLYHSHRFISAHGIPFGFVLLTITTSFNAGCCSRYQLPIPGRRWKVFTYRWTQLMGRPLLNT